MKDIEFILTDTSSYRPNFIEANLTDYGCVFALPKEDLDLFFEKFLEFYASQFNESSS